MGSHTRELVTLQLGHYANFVGAHWWNIQESSFVYSTAEARVPKEINHDVLFREGQNLSGETTFTPRLIAVDLKGSLNTLKQDGQLYDEASNNYSEDVLWGDDVTLHQAESAQKNEYLHDLQMFDDGELSTQDDNSPESDRDESVPTGGGDAATCVKHYSLEDSINVWSDFLRPHLHPKSIHLLYDYQHQNDLHRFDMYGYGRTAAEAGVDYDALEDSLHYFMEECDHLQGVTVLVDTHDGFGGLGTAVMHHLQDDYGTRNMFVYGLTPPSFSATDEAIRRAALLCELAEEIDRKSVDCGYRVLNSVLAFNDLTAGGAAFVPLATDCDMWQPTHTATAFPHMEYKCNLWYHTSAILGASIDTATLPCRLSTGPSLLAHLTDALTPCGRKMLGLQTSMPFPFMEHGDLFNSLMALGEVPPWHPVTPFLSNTTAPYTQSVVLRGILPEWKVGSFSPSTPREIRRASTIEEVMELYLRETFSSTLSACCSVQQPTEVAAPFPNIFSPDISQHGHITSDGTGSLSVVDNVPMMTALQTSPCTADLLETMLKQSARLKLGKFTNLLESGVERDEYAEAISGLQALRDNYRQQIEGFC